MSGIGWQVSDEDIVTVLLRHGLRGGATEARATELIEAADARIEEAALQYGDLDAQACGAMDEIEQVLFEAGLVAGRTDWHLL